MALNERPELIKYPFVQDITNRALCDPFLEVAYKFGQWAHKDQFRKTGEPYFDEHCKKVADLLIYWGINNRKMLAAALLHDTVEDSTEVTIEMIENLFPDKQFGAEVAYLVDGVSKFKNPDGMVGTDEQTQQKVLERSYVDPRVAVLKLADRYHNMLTLHGLKPEKRIEKAKETSEVYVPLAKSLGMWNLKSAFEDLSFVHLNEEEYRKVKNEVDSDPRVDEDFLEQMCKVLEEVGRKEKLEPKIEVRLNGYWNLKEKRIKKARSFRNSIDTFADINDLVSFRVRVKERKDCYIYLGLLREIFSSQIDLDRHDDFIARPAYNHYQAIQETVNLAVQTNNRSQAVVRPVEVAIMTNEMEELNNWGVVSLLRNGDTDKLSEYTLKVIKTSLGQLKFLPKNATGIDVAFAMNDDIGSTARRIIVNGVEKDLSYNIPNGSTVEVISDFTKLAPDEETIYFSLPETRKKIESQRAIPKLLEKAAIGRKAIEDILKPRGIIDLSDFVDIDEMSPRLHRLLAKLDVDGLDSLYYKLAMNFERKEHIEKVLNEEGITKEKLGMTSVRVRGENKIGVMDYLSSVITDLEGNIMNTRVRLANGIYQLRFVIQNLNKEKEDKLRTELEKKGIFIEVTVV